MCELERIERLHRLQPRSARRTTVELDGSTDDFATYLAVCQGWIVRLHVGAFPVQLRGEVNWHA